MFFSKDEDLLHDDDNDVESSVKDKLRSLFQLLQVPNDNMVNEISNKGNHNILRALRVQQQIFRITNVVNTALFDLLYKKSAAEKLKEAFYEMGYIKSNSKAKLIDNILALSFHRAK